MEPEEYFTTEAFKSLPKRQRLLIRLKVAFITFISL
jgi:hypothetical protein